MAQTLRWFGVFLIFYVVVWITIGLIIDDLSIPGLIGSIIGIIIAGLFFAWWKKSRV